MEILCDQCGTSYFFDETRAVSDIMRFKCSKCGHIFETRVSTPEPEEERPLESKDELAALSDETVKINMRRRLEEIQEDQKLEEQKKQEDQELEEEETEEQEEEETAEQEEEEKISPDESPIIVEGVIGATEAGLDETEVSDIDIGEPFEPISPGIDAARHDKSKALRLVPTMLVAALVIAAVSFGVYIMGSTLAPGLIEILPRGVQTYFTRSSKSAIKNLALRDVEGFFSRNNVVGHIYVVKGRVENQGKNPFRNIRLKAILYNDKGYPLMESAVFCGIDMSDHALATLSGGEIYENMTAFPPEGSSILKPSNTMPFTVVFIDLPKDIYEYSISIIGADSIS